MNLLAIRRLFVVSANLALVCLIPVHAQNSSAQVREPATSARDWSKDIPAHLSVVDGTVTLERDNRLEPAEANLALLAGDRLRTRGGRVEILFEDGSALYLDESSELDLLADGLVRLIDGRMRLLIARATASLEYRVDAPAASVWITAAGEYRVSARRANDPEVELLVIRGSAELANEHGRTLVRAGMSALASSGLAPSLPYATNSAAWDDFDRWADQQRALRLGGASAKYLPEEVRTYSSDFDQYGSWDYEAPYGYVWYPRVATGWRPYSQGRWNFTAQFGWLWVGIDHWSWPTHHYGRWGMGGGGWYWIPDHRWSPAWVSWGGAPGYVSWCPLGYNGRPVIGFGGYYADPWVAWTVMPAQVFIPNVWVTQHVVAHNSIAPGVRGQFMERGNAPMVQGSASARRMDPLRAPTTARNDAGPRQPPNVGTGGARTDVPLIGSAVPRGSGVVIPAARDSGSAVARSGLAAPAAPSMVTADRSGDVMPARTAAPERSRLMPPSTERAEPARIESPRSVVPRTITPVTLPQTDARGYYSVGAQPRTAVPRQAGEATATTQGRQIQRLGPNSDAPAHDATAVPRTRTPMPDAARPTQMPTSPASDAPRGFSRVPDRTPPPSAPSAFSARPAAPPVTSAPPSRGRAPEAAPAPASTTSSPPSRGGGSPRAVPRARGGSGGD